MQVPQDRRHAPCDILTVGARAGGTRYIASTSAVGDFPASGARMPRNTACTFHPASERETANEPPVVLAPVINEAG
jgi:hypothetical protein